LSLLLPAALALNLVLPLTPQGDWALSGSAAADSQKVTLTSAVNDLGALATTSTTTAISWHLHVDTDISAPGSDEQIGFSVWFSSNQVETSSSNVFGVPSKFTGVAVLFDFRSNSVQAVEYVEGAIKPSEENPICLFRAMGPVRLHFTAVLGQISLGLKNKQSEETPCLTIHNLETHSLYLGISAKSGSKTPVSFTVNSIAYTSSMTQEEKLQQLAATQQMLQRQISEAATKFLDETTSFRQQSQTETAKIKSELERLTIEAQVTSSKLKKVRTKLVRPTPPEMMTVFADAINDKLELIDKTMQHFAKRVEHGDDTHRILDYIEWSAKRMSWPEEDLRKASENLAKHSEHVSTRISEKRTFLYLYCGLGAVFAYACFVLFRAKALKKQHSY